MNLKCLLLTLVLAVPAGSSAFATVVVTSPSNASTVGASAHYVATANTSCAFGVATVGVYVDNTLMYVGNGSALDVSVPLTPGAHNTYVQAWDYCGRSSGTPVQVVSNAQGGVSITSPADGSTVGNNASFAASATTSCAQGVAAVGVYANNQLVAKVPGSALNQQVSLPSGQPQVVVQAWDNCGGSQAKSLNLTVQTTGSRVRQSTPVISDIQLAPNWNQWGELAPVYDVCSPCSGVWWGLTQDVSNVSLSGHAARFDIGGSVAYSDVLWSNKIVGQGTTKNLPDDDRKILPNIHNLQYDVDVFVTNFAVSQDLEFDANIYIDGNGMEWGTECNHLADGDWDIWDPQNRRWVATGAPCALNDQAWNHVSLSLQRLGNNGVQYNTITVNGNSYTINQSFAPFSVPGGWYGMTVNFQMDGNYQMASNTTYLDNLNIRYW